MTERALIGVEMAGSDSALAVTSQKRDPYWENLGNGYLYGPTSNSFGIRTLSVVDSTREDTRHKSLCIVYTDIRGCGSRGISLGEERNQLDVCLYGVSADSRVYSEVYGFDQAQADAGEIQHDNGVVFDRRVVVPIHAGTLSLHLTAKSYRESLPASPWVSANGHSFVQPVSGPQTVTVID